MSTISKLGHEVSIAGRVALRHLRSSLTGRQTPAPDTAEFRARCARWLHPLPDDLLIETVHVDLPGNEPPWFDTGLDLRAGDTVTWLACGRVYLSRLLDIWVGPGFQLWGRVGATGTVFSGTRDTFSFTAEKGGRLFLASYFPAEWSTRSGELATDPGEYRKASGSLSVRLLRWRRHQTPAEGLARLTQRTDAPAQASAEIRRLGSVVKPPSGWQYLWFLGDAEIYSPANGSRGIACRTHGDVGILQTAFELPLTTDTFLEWEWRVDQLPSELAEDTLPTHDYLSIAVEFDNGQDITWHWSAKLPVETIYRCPLPTWKHRETHIVIRQGPRGLGRWQAESRNVFEDCVNALGAPADRIVKIWLIANSLFQRKPGQVEYRNIRVVSHGSTHAINQPPRDASS